MARRSCSAFRRRRRAPAGDVFRFLDRRNHRDRRRLAGAARAVHRPVAFILSGEMAVAYWMFHAPRNLYPTLNGGDAAILYCFVFLFLAAAGPGVWAVDTLRKRG